MGFPVSILSVLKITASLQDKELRFESKFRYSCLAPDVMKWKYFIKLFIHIIYFQNLKAKLLEMHANIHFQFLSILNIKSVIKSLLIPENLSLTSREVKHINFPLIFNPHFILGRYLCDV